MKTKTLALILLFITTLFTACSKSAIENENSFDRSLKAWTNFKNSTSNTYSYTVSIYSWPDHRSETTISVTNGKVTQRYYKNTSTTGLENAPKEALEWTEKENELNTHRGSYAAQPLTLDEIYDKAKTHWLLKRPDSKPVFETKNNGMISSAGFSAPNCMDDCFDGINIISIQ